MGVEAPGFPDQQGRPLFQTQPGCLCCYSGFWRGGCPPPEPTGQRTATALSKSSPTRAQARAGPALGQGQYLQLSSCQPTAQGHRTEAKEGGAAGSSGRLVETQSPHTQREQGPGLPPLKSLKDAAAETRQVGQRGKSKGKARTSLEWGQGNCLSLPQLPVHPPQPLRCRKQA